MGKVLVVGATGMLGSMVCRVLSAKGHTVVATQRRDAGRPDHLEIASDAAGVDRLLSAHAPLDLVVNCAGITDGQARTGREVWQAALVNGAFPRQLGEAAERIGSRVVHVSTDGVFRGGPRPLLEDSPCDAATVYGMTKRLGEADGPSFLSVRCSIVGPAPNGRGLLAWLLARPRGATVSGWTNHVWNGVTTLQLAEWIAPLVAARAFDRLRAASPVLHYAPNRPISKYRLLRLFARLFRPDVRVEPAEAEAVRRVLRSRFEPLLGIRPGRLPMEDAVRKLAPWLPMNPRPR
jgi:dTDP-4-dehydrorhamnose reductase